MSTATAETVDLKQISTDQLKKLLEEREEAERQDRILKRKTYERGRDNLVLDLVTSAQFLHDNMKNFKQSCMHKLEQFAKDAAEYGDIKANSKGGFSLRNTEGDLMVSFDRNTKPEYDERSSLAEQLLKDFLQDKVKKRDQQTYNMVSALMERNKAGDFNPSSINALIKIRDNFNDERWLKAIELFEESYRTRQISYSVSFYTKDDMGKDKNISLTFASLPYQSSIEDDQEIVKLPVKKKK